jgi:putative transposase
MRKPRKLVSGAVYHVTAGANRKEFILNSPEMKRLFLKVIKRAKSKYAFKVTNFCIMGNHIHLLIKPLGKENLSRIMQWILATFAINFNIRFNISGHVWYDRFHSKVIESFRQYIELNHV